MVESGILGIRLRPVGRVLLAALGGALVTLLVLLLFYRVGGLQTIVLTGTDLQLASGEGGQTAAGLEIRQTDPQGLAAVQGPTLVVQAALYRHLSWQVDGIEPGRELRLVWSTIAEPRTLWERVLPSSGPDGGVLDLGVEPHWRGQIVGVGLIVRGPLSQPLVVHRLALRPETLSPVELLRWAVGEWTAFEGWSQRSAHYTISAPLDALFPPVLVVALWVGFSAALYAIFSPPHRLTGWWIPYAALFLLGWLVLDLRWQWELGLRLALARELFAGKDEIARRLADCDGGLYQFLLEVRRKLPARPARLFIVSNNPQGFQAGRARYHLLPHNGYAGFSRPPLPRLAHDGDYVLILSPVDGIRYNRSAQALEWEKKRLPAEMLYVAPDGALFRVMGKE